MLKKSARVVLASFRSSTYPRGSASALHSLRPCWTNFSSILPGILPLPQTRWPLNFHRATIVFRQPARFVTSMGLVGLVMFACLVFGVGPVQSAEGPKAGSKLHRVIMHLNSGDEKVQKGTLNNIKNLYEALGAERVNVELVAHGAGLSLFTKQDTKLAEELARLKTSYGVSYTACSNTMKAQGLTRADLIDQVDRAMPAMVRLMELQEQGWAYIKP